MRFGREAAQFARDELAHGAEPAHFQAFATSRATDGGISRPPRWSWTTVQNRARGPQVRGGSMAMWRSVKRQAPSTLRSRSW